MFLHGIDVISEWAGKFASFAILIMIMTIIWDVVLRYVFNAGAMWGYGSYGKLLLFYIVFGAAYALLTRAHVNVDIVYHRFPLRVRAVTDMITASLTFLFCIILLLHTLPPAYEQALRLKLSPRIFSPAGWPLAMLVPIGLLFFLLQGLSKFIRDLVTALTGKETL